MTTNKELLKQFNTMVDESADTDEKPIFNIAGAEITLRELCEYLKKIIRDEIVPLYYLNQWEEFIIDYALVLENARNTEIGVGNHPLYEMYLWIFAIRKDGKVMLT